MTRCSSIVLTPQPEGGYTATSSDVPDLATEGNISEEACAMARNWAEGLILASLDVGNEIPDESGCAEVATIA